MRYIVDRIENDIIVLEAENGTQHNLSLSIIPNAHEGDVINICINKEETVARKNKIENLFNSLLK